MGKEWGGGFKAPVVCNCCNSLRGGRGRKRMRKQGSSRQVQETPCLLAS